MFYSARNHGFTHSDCIQDFYELSLQNVICQFMIYVDGLIRYKLNKLLHKSPNLRFFHLKQFIIICIQGNDYI